MTTFNQKQKEIKKEHTEYEWFYEEPDEVFKKCYEQSVRKDLIKDYYIERIAPTNDGYWLIKFKKRFETIMREK